MSRGYVSADVKSTSVRERLERERFEREEAAAQEAKLRPALDAYQETLRQLDKSQKDLVRQFYSRPVEIIRTEIRANHPNAVDEGLNVPEGRCDQETWQRVGSEWADSITARTGITLSVVAVARVFAYTIAQARAGKNMTTIAAWDVAYNRLHDAGAFSEDEIGFDESLHTVVAPPEPAPVPTMKDLMTADVGTQEGQRQARQIADDLYEQEVLPIYAEWRDFLYRTYSYVLTREDADLIEQWFQRTQSSRIDRRSYDAVRKHFVLNLHRWPMSMLSAEEQALIAIENVERLPNESDWAYRRRCQLARG